MRYYFYHCIPNNNKIIYKLQYIFSSEKEFLEFLHYGQHRYPYYNRDTKRMCYENPYLDEINITGKDTMVFDKTYLRPYLFTDETGKHIDTRQYFPLLKDKPTGIHIYSWIDWKRMEEKRKNKRQQRHHTYFDISHNKLRHLILDQLDPDYPEFNTKAKKAWNFESFRRISGNWKHQGKQKHQWEHNLSKKQHHMVL